MTFRSLYGIIILAVTTVAKINGEVSEWFKEAVLKTVCPQGRVGSNPTPCAFFCLKTDMQKKTKKFLTNANEFDKINELLIERTAKKFERASKNRLKKFLTNEKFCDKINELIRVGTAEILDN